MNKNNLLTRRVMAAIVAFTFVLALGQIFMPSAGAVGQIFMPSASAGQDSFVSVQSRHNFDNTVKKLKEQITAHKLAVLKQYNVQGMLKKAGVKSSDKHLNIAVFHPRYGKILFDSDKNSISAAPPRMIIREQNGKVVVGYHRPSALFAAFNVPDSLTKELDGLFHSIVKKSTQ